MKKNEQEISFNQLVLLLFRTVSVFAVVGLFCLCAFASGATIKLSGFGADSAGRIYVGRDQSIEVYENGKMIHEIQPKTSRGYGFRIQPNDTIELIVDPLIYTLDLQGNVISETPVGDKDGNTPVHNYRSVQATNGAVYNLENTLGYYRIVCNGKTVYRMPTLDYIVLLLMVGNFVRAAVMIPRLIVRWKKYDEQQKRRQI